MAQGIIIYLLLVGICFIFSNKYLQAATSPKGIWRYAKITHPQDYLVLGLSCFGFGPILFFIFNKNSSPYEEEKLLNKRSLKFLFNKH